MRLFAATSPAAMLSHSSSDEAGEIIENAHIDTSIRKQRQPAGEGVAAAAGTSGRTSTRAAAATEPRCSAIDATIYSNHSKSRSLERYAGAPSHQQLQLQLPPYATPSGSTRRRLLSPFRSIKRRSRSSSSSGESQAYNHLAVVVANAAAAATVSGQAKASSQSGDSGTGGTELEHELELELELEQEDQDDHDESSQLSLSYSQLSSSGCDEPDADADDEAAATTTVATVATSTPTTTATHSKSVTDVADERRHRNVLSIYSSSSEDQLHCRIGDITLMDDTYSNCDPQNDAERMFLQIVGMLRDENEVCVLATLPPCFTCCIFYMYVWYVRL